MSLFICWYFWIIELPRVVSWKAPTKKSATKMAISEQAVGNGSLDSAPYGPFCYSVHFREILSGYFLFSRFDWSIFVTQLVAKHMKEIII
jgi:hypothetical protein